jgi:metal-responsive CopG/Arc/MetJ family transcriptional regulator
MGKPMRTVSIKLPADLDQALTELSERRHTSRSALLREAVERLTREERETVGELASDLIGSLEGPKDLSTSPKHMKGFGE